MNIYNKFLEDLEHKNRVNSILYNDINDQLLSKKTRNSSLNNLLSTRPQIKENINKIKMKYGIDEEGLNQQNLHHQIFLLKNKYIKHNSNKYKIDSVNNVNIISNNKNKIHKKELYKNLKKKTHSVDLDFEKMKNNSFRDCNFNNMAASEKEKMDFSLSSNELMNNNSKMNLNLNNENYDIDKKGKNNNYQNYLKNKRNEYNKIDQKIREILEDEYLSPEKIKKFTNIFPISKRINILSDIKKEIKSINNNTDNYLNDFNNSYLSQLSCGTYTTVGFNIIKPKIKRQSLYDNIFNKNNNLISKFSYYEISKNNELEKPVLIKHLNKPKNNTFSNFFKI